MTVKTPTATKSTKDRFDTWWQFKYSHDFVAQNIEIPQTPSMVPNVLGWSGPARSGTTALLLLLAGHSEVGHVYFQPQKTLLRLGAPGAKLYPTDGLACMKEPFFSWEIVDDPHDPIEILLKAGVPAEKITWVIMLRDPGQTFRSWGIIEPGVKPDPDVFAFWQDHAINLWHKYKDSDVKIVPFVYEFLEGQEEYAIQKLLSAVGVNNAALSLEFNRELINKKLVLGQATDKEFYRRYIDSVLKKGRYMYTTNNYPVDEAMLDRVVATCQAQYEDFAKMASKTLGLI